MNEIQEKAKNWAERMQSQKWSGISYELKEFLSDTKFTLLTSDETTATKTNKMLMKLLVYLTHAADKSDKSDKNTGHEIWTIATCLCSKMSCISDEKKFFASVFYITSSLISMGLHSQAMEVCDFVLNGTFIDKEINSSDTYSKILNLWRKTAVEFMNNMKILNREDCESLAVIVKYELNVTKLAYESYSQHIMYRILVYCESLSAKMKEFTSYRNDFHDSMLDFIIHSKITLNDESANKTFRSICRIIAESLLIEVNKSKIGSIEREISKWFEAFRSFVSRTSFERCYRLYEKLCRSLLRPIEKFSANTIEEINSCRENLRSMINEHGTEESSLYLYSVIALLQVMFPYWENTMKSPQVANYVTTDMIVATMKLIDEQSEIFDAFKLTDCRCNAEKCIVDRDLYNSVTMKSRGLSFIARAITLNINDEICAIILNFGNKCVTRIAKLKNLGCGNWIKLWKACGAHAYNIAIACESRFHNTSVELYRLICVNFVKFEGLHGEQPILSRQIAMPTILHRLSSVCYRNGRYEEAMMSCSLNGLLSLKIPDSKAYQIWGTIKTKEKSAERITIIQYLKSKEKEIEKISHFNLRDYDLVEVCMRELQGLQETRVNVSTSMIAVLDEMEKLKVSAETYAKGVQLLGYHGLNFQSDVSIMKYVQKAISAYKREAKPSISFRLIYGHLKFYEFVDSLREYAIQTSKEMEVATRTCEAGSLSPLESFVPSYSTINLTVTTSLALSLSHALNAWSNINHTPPSHPWIITQTLHVLLIIGEYARLYGFESSEVRAWKMAFDLARELDDRRAIIYIAARNLSNSRENRELIEEADKSVKIIEKLDDPELRIIIRRYRLCLADFYFRKGEHKRARMLFNIVTSDPDFTFLTDLGNSFLRIDIMMNYFLSDTESVDQSTYIEMIVKSLYTMISMKDIEDTVPWGYKEEQLFSCDILLTFTNNFALRMNSLLSFREISAHLLRRLTLSHKLVAAMRVAECLKSLCYIDLSREHLEDCEAKLQGLEHILEIEALDLPKKSKLTSSLNLHAASQSYVVEAVRDLGQNDASPILRKKAFELPEFIDHIHSCTCMKCKNRRYQHLVFAATHIRAQLFSLQRNTNAAFEHFYGALKIRKNILDREKSIGCGQNQQDIVEYVLFHLDYCRFLRWAMPEKRDHGIKIALDALELCNRYNLKSHPVFISVNEVLFEYRHEDLYTADDYSKFTVPDINAIDVSQYSHSEEPIPCVTPIREIPVQKAISVRRRKTPPFLDLKKMPIGLTEDDPVVSTPKPSSVNRARRKLIDQNDIEPEVEKIPRQNKPLSTISRDKMIPRKASKLAISSKNSKTCKKDETGKETCIVDDELAHEIKELTVQPLAATYSRKKLKQDFASRTVGSAAQVTPQKVDDVVELLDEMTLAERQESSLVTPKRKIRNTVKTSDTEKPKKSLSNLAVKEKAILVCYDSADPSEDDTTVSGTRTSMRLRRSKSATDIAKTNTEVDKVGTKSRRRVASSTSQDTACDESKPTKKTVRKKNA